MSQSVVRVENGFPAKEIDMTENEKRYEDFVRALKELCRSHGVVIDVSSNDEIVVWDGDGLDASFIYVENRLGK